MLDKNLRQFINDKNAKISVVLKDLKKDKLIYKYKEARQMPSASIIKIIIMLEALKQVIKGKFKLDEVIDIKEEDKVEYSIITELEINKYTFKDIITLMIIVSDNSATNILIDLLGIENINRIAKELGLENTVLQRKMMDFEAIKAGRQNYISPLDMVKVFELIYKKEVLNEDMCNLMLNILKRQKDKEMLSRYLKPEIVIAHKTGELENLNHDIGIVYLGDIEYILGVFVTDSQNNLECKKIIGSISKIVYDHFKNQGGINSEYKGVRLCYN